MELERRAREVSRPAPKARAPLPKHLLDRRSLMSLKETTTTATTATTTTDIPLLLTASLSSSSSSSLEGILESIQVKPIEDLFLNGDTGDTNMQSL